MVGGVLGLALVGDISVESVVMIGDVSHSLDTTVRKSNGVVALSIVSVALLILGKVSSRIVIVDGVVKGVRLRLFLVLGLLVVARRLVSSRLVGSRSRRIRGSGHSQEGGNEEDLEERMQSQAKPFILLHQ